MTTRDLQLAQFFLGSYQEASAYAARLDPGRKRKSYVVNQLDGIASKAAAGFVAVAGRHPAGVNMTDLNTTNPAAWTRKRLAT